MGKPRGEYLTRTSPPPRIGTKTVQLPKVERVIYWVFTILSLVHLLFQLYKASLDHYDELNDYFMTTGWSILKRKKDESNFEWEFWRHWMPLMAPHFAVHAIIGQAVRWNNATFKYRSYILMVVDIALSVHLIGVQPVIMFASHCTLVYVTGWIFHQPSKVWMVSLVMLYSLNMEYTLDNMKQMLNEDPFERKFFLVVMATAWCNLRYTSFTLEMCNKSKDDVNGYSFLDVLAYVFYFPQYINGPHQNYDTYKKQMSDPLISWTRSRILAWSLDFLRVVFWWLVMEVLLHYIYTSAIILNPALLVKLPPWTLGGLLIYQGCFFGIKYIAFYGLSEKLAELDQLVPPHRPGCVWRIYTYSEMWKTFDRGLHQFMKRYIYIPLGGSQKGFGRQLLASSLSFTFVYIWHGTLTYILVWSVLNYLGIVAEAIGVRLEKHHRVLTFKHSHPCAYIRLSAAVCSVLYFSSLLSLAFFFGDVAAGIVYCQKFLVNGFPTPLLPTLVVLYMWLNVSRDTDAWLVQRRNQCEKKTG